ncbi:NAD(P)-dependent alcohol dehydrogenase [Aureibacter tunicatorum]|uniref:NADPH:quinone reductase-like Zn-dependent oxidoreductase n=1 Tax=Aureibacter tunicatorum TaxID=866807 RepID=A0AAE4BUA6_9BACT|nr:NAD(P)-dependent alcohol dehydrogenase [Aureibacter tunicatorum]MDR6240568.1 NADPH:quinone reductase-like Zn-dependent oxidoreductase [Aureibacter tunicatorum]BDD06571.1 NADPH:quinone reductase [Aureibacter tunicatorum]
MKAVVCKGYGNADMLKVMNVSIPEISDNDILVKVHATSITSAHCMMRKGQPYFSRLFTGFFKPTQPILGTDFAGEIVRVGKSVETFKVGDKVFGPTDLNGGAYSEFVKVKETSTVFNIPEGIDCISATGIIDGGMTAIAFFEKYRNENSKRILINGASGSIGASSVQLAKYFGMHVTAVCSQNNVAWVKKLGADDVVDYTKCDVMKLNCSFDLIFDTVGKLNFSKSKSILSGNGIFLTPVLSLNAVGKMLFSNNFSRQKLFFEATGLKSEVEKRKDFEFLCFLLRENKLTTVIDRVYSLEEVSDAHKYVELGHKKGNVVLKL